jgi:hypothetical protein
MRCGRCDSFISFLVASAEVEASPVAVSVVFRARAAVDAAAALLLTIRLLVLLAIIDAAECRTASLQP